MLMTILSLVLEPNTYSILIKNDETNTLSSTGINKQDSSPWSGTTTLDQNLKSTMDISSYCVTFSENQMLYSGIPR